MKPSTFSDPNALKLTLMNLKHRGKMVLAYIILDFFKSKRRIYQVKYVDFRLILT